MRNTDYVNVLQQIDKNRFENNLLEDGIREICKSIEGHEPPSEYFLELIFDGVCISTNDSAIPFYGGEVPDVYLQNVYICFDRCISRRYESIYRVRKNDLENKIISVMRLVSGIKEGSKRSIGPIDFGTIHASKRLSSLQKKEFFTVLSEYAEIPKTCKQLSDWLADREARKQISQTESFIDSL